MILSLQISPFAKLTLSFTDCSPGSGHCGLSSFSVAAEEAPVKVSDSIEGLLADKRGVNSSVSLSLQGAGMTDHQRLEGYRLEDWTSQNWAVSDLAVITDILLIMWGYGYLCTCTGIFFFFFLRVFFNHVYSY